jgi:hypothetical protein
MHTVSTNDQAPRRQPPGPLDFVVGTLEGATAETLAEAWHGGKLQLDEGRVGAFVDRQLIGWIECDVLLGHLHSGGTAYFKSSGAYDERMMFCTLHE